MVFFLVGCGGDAPTAVSEAPAATSAPEQTAATSTPEPPTTTPTPVPPAATPTPAPPTATPTPESLSLQLGDTFTVDSYQVKLIQVEERPSIIALTSDNIGAVAPKQNENVWLVLAIEITNSGNETVPLTFLPSSAVILEADGQQVELSSVGVLAPADNAIVLGFIEGQKLTKGFFGGGASGRIFVIPDGSQKLLFAGGARNIIGDPNGPQWDLGNLPSEKATQISLLFEVPAGASELTWQFLGSTPVGIPASQTTSLTDEQGPGMTIELAKAELCQIAESLELECK